MWDKTIFHKTVGLTINQSCRILESLLMSYVNIQYQIRKQRGGLIYENKETKSSLNLFFHLFLPFNHQKNGAYITYLFLINETIETYNLNKVKEFTVLKDREIANMTISLTIYLMRQKIN